MFLYDSAPSVFFSGDCNLPEKIFVFLLQYFNLSQITANKQIEKDLVFRRTRRL